MTILNINGWNIVAEKITHYKYSEKLNETVVYMGNVWVSINGDITSKLTSELKRLLQAKAIHIEV